MQLFLFFYCPTMYGDIVHCVNEIYTQTTLSRNRPFSQCLSLLSLLILVKNILFLFLYYLFYLFIPQHPYQGFYPLTVYFPILLQDIWKFSSCTCCITMQHVILMQKFWVSALTAIIHPIL